MAVLGYLGQCSDGLVGWRLQLCFGGRCSDVGASVSAGSNQSSSTVAMMVYC